MIMELLLEKGANCKWKKVEMVYKKQGSLLKGWVYDGLSGLCGVNSPQHFPVTFKSLIFSFSLFQT